MAFAGLFRKKGHVSGTVLVRGMPESEMFSVSLAFFRVEGASAAAPFDGQPPPDHYVDDAPVKEAEENQVMPFSFRFERPPRFYYLDVGVIAYLRRDGKMFAQVERFFPLSKPVEVRGGSVECQVALVADWPTIPFDELGTYGVIKPR